MHIEECPMYSTSQWFNDHPQACRRCSGGGEHLEGGRKADLSDSITVKCVRCKGTGAEPETCPICGHNHTKCCRMHGYQLNTTCKQCFPQAHQRKYESFTREQLLRSIEQLEADNRKLVAAGETFILKLTGMSAEDLLKVLNKKRISLEQLQD